MRDKLSSNFTKFHGWFFLKNGLIFTEIYFCRIDILNIPRGFTLTGYLNPIPYGGELYCPPLPPPTPTTLFKKIQKWLNRGIWDFFTFNTFYFATYCQIIVRNEASGGEVWPIRWTWLELNLMISVSSALGEFVKDAEVSNFLGWPTGLSYIFRTY